MKTLRILAIDDHEMTMLGYKFILEGIDFDSILGGRDVPAWSLHSPYKSLETLIFRMLGRIAAQESYQGRF